MGWKAELLTAQPLWQQGSLRAAWDTKARWQDVRPARKPAGIFNRRLQGWQAGTAAGQMKGLAGPAIRHGFLQWNSGAGDLLSGSPLSVSGTHSSCLPPQLRGFQGDHTLLTRSPAPMAGWLHGVREPVKHRSQSDSAEPDSLPYSWILPGIWTSWWVVPFSFSLGLLRWDLDMVSLPEDSLEGKKTPVESQASKNRFQYLCYSVFLRKINMRSQFHNCNSIKIQ